MLYATMDKQRWDSLPAEWDKVQDMFKYLNRMVWGYQLTFESRMFSTQYGAQYRCSLIRWEDGRNVVKHTSGKTREVLLETDDHTQMEATLFMLCNEAEAEYKAAKQKISWVP